MASSLSTGGGKEMYSLDFDRVHPGVGGGGVQPSGT